MVAPTIHESSASWTEIGGQQAHLERAGSGAPLLMLHGLLGGSFCWRFNIPVLATKRSIYAPDLPGMGLSPASRGTDCGMRAQAERLKRFIESRDLDQIDVVASSWGGGLAMLLASGNERVRSLVLVAPVNPWSEFGRSRVRFCASRLGSLLVHAGLPLSRKIHDVGVKRMYGDPLCIASGTLEGYSERLKRRGLASNLINTLRNWQADMAVLREAIPRVQAPTLLVWGSLDGAVDPRSADSLMMSLRNCQVKFLPGIGHLPFEASPEVFNRLVLDFIDHPG